jgi:hypothetical protein
MSDPVIAVVMLCLFIVIVMLGFPIAFTLIAMGIGFGYYAYYDVDRMQHLFDNRIFDLFVQNTFSVMSNDVLVAVPLFLFMGYVVERANIVNRLFFSIQMAARHLPGSMAVAALFTCAIFATASGIVGAVVTLMGMLAFPAMLKANYDESFAAGVICAGGCLGILIPPSIMLIVYSAIAEIPLTSLRRGPIPWHDVGGSVYGLRCRTCGFKSKPCAKTNRGRRTTIRHNRLGTYNVVYPISSTHYERAWCHLNGISNTGRSSWRRCCWRFSTRFTLSLTELGTIKTSRISDRKNIGYGLLVVCRVVDVRLRIFIPRWA